MQSSEPPSTEEISLSIEETNKVRISLGLAPLDTSKTNTADQVAKKNYDERIASERSAAAEKDIRRRIDRSRAKRKASEMVKGVSELGESGEDDHLAWIRRQKERQSALMKAKALDEEDSEFQQIAQAEYKKDDLGGLTIRHSIRDVTDSETVLVLQDANILDDVDDELVNPTLVDKEKGRENIKNKRAKLGYNALEDEEEEFQGRLGDGSKRKNMLKQYDGTQAKSFTLNERGELELQEDEDPAKVGENVADLKRSFEIKDYLTKEEAETTFKKKSKSNKKKRSSRKKEISPGPEMANGDANGDIQMLKKGKAFEHSNVKTSIDEVSFVDDDDLQRALDKSRRAKLAQTLPKQDPAEQIVQLTESAPQTEDMEAPETLILDEAREFVRNLGAGSGQQQEEQEDKDGDRVMIQKRKTTKAETATSADVPKWKKELGSRANASAEMEIDDVPLESKTSELVIPQTPVYEEDIGLGLESEPVISTGIGSTVQLLKQKGIMETANPEQVERERRQEWKEALLRTQNSAMHASESKLSKREQAKREKERARELEERFRGYNPVINLNYHDEFGRNVGPKEAFQIMSHKFHGKKPGKMKTEKRLKKLDEERRLQGMSSTDTPYGLVGGLVQRQKESGEAHVLLSVGNRGVLDRGEGSRK